MTDPFETVYVKMCPHGRVTGIVTPNDPPDDWAFTEIGKWAMKGHRVASVPHKIAETSLYSKCEECDKAVKT